MQDDNQADSSFDELADLGWVPGEIPQLRIGEDDESSDPRKFWLPTEALTRGGRGLWTVYVVKGTGKQKVCEKQSVEILKTNGNLALVQGMIKRGDVVIKNGVHRIGPGMSVDIVEEASP